MSPPKVDAKYVERKRDKILDAAFVVAMRKPMHEVSMRDIIAESGLSQGGIYRYYSNIDEILIELINRESVIYDVKSLVDEVISSDKAPERVIGEILSVWEKAILDNLIGIGKIYYEICVVYVNDKKRLKNFMSNISFAAKEAYLWENFFHFIIQKISEGYFNLKIPLENLFGLHTVTLDGMIRDLILCKYYTVFLPFPGTLEKEKLIENYCTALVLLLGGNEKLIYEEILT